MSMDRNSDRKARFVEVLHLVLGGGFRYLNELNGFSQEDADVLGKDCTDFHVSPEDVLVVIKEYVEGNVSQTVAQEWGELVRFHRFGLKGQPYVVLPFDLIRGFDEDEEDLVVDFASRLDELGDAIDGEITKEDFHQLTAMCELFRSSSRLRQEQ